jgi:hypothetical protein
MKNIKIYLMLTTLILLLASCSADTENIMPEIPNDEVKLYILDDIHERWYTRFLLTIGDNEIYFEGLARQWNEAPTPITADLTGDGIPEIIVIFDTSLGIGINIQEIHIFDGVTFEKYEVRCPIEILDEHLTLTADDEHYYVDTGTKMFIINKADITNRLNETDEIKNYDLYIQAEYLSELPDYYFFCMYIIQNEVLHAYLPINVGGTLFYGMIEIIYEFVENKFVFTNIKVISEDFFIIYNEYRLNNR